VGAMMAFLFRDELAKKRRTQKRNMDVRHAWWVETHTTTEREVRDRERGGCFWTSSFLKECVALSTKILFLPRGWMEIQWVLRDTISHE
jgi:hypothetical protein